MTTARIETASGISLETRISKLKKYALELHQQGNDMQFIKETIGKALERIVNQSELIIK